MRHFQLGVRRSSSRNCIEVFCLLAHSLTLFLFVDSTIFEGAVPFFFSYCPSNIAFKMNGVHRDGKNTDFKKMYPGCLGRMANLFELNAGVPANRLLNDKPHSAGFRSDVSIMNPSADPRESDVNNSFQNRKSNATPMKMLIAQEMSVEMDPKRDPPNLVAKLMGIDALPQHEPGSTTQRSHSRIHHRSNLDIPTHKVVHERWQQSPKSLPKGRYEVENMNDRKMNLVRQKFVEAKRLSMDEKLRQSKQFHDALDVLNSNKDLFLKCLQEPNSTHLYSHPPPETKRITVLRPSKLTNGNNNNSAGTRYRDEQQINRGTFLGPDKQEKIHLGSPPAAGLKCDGNSSQPTRIVVLKPSPGKPHNNVKAMGSPKAGLPNILLNEDFFGEGEDDVCRESREVAKEITQQMRERIGKHRRDETLFSSVFSNGYVGDESSFNKSESEVISPVSRRSWDYADRLGSPYSSSLYTRASYSPESSVCREAKKRLSERWATMASSGFCQEQILFQRSTSTLGDMLALSETKAEAFPREEPENSAHLDSEHRREENVECSPINLMRSKSVPVSSTTEFGTTLNVSNSVSDKRKLEFLKEDIKERNVKSSSFRGKVSSLFFSRNKKPGINKSLVSGPNDETHSFPGDFFSEKLSGCASPSLLELNPIDKPGMVSPETGSAVAEPIASRDKRENHDLSSLISVLDPPLEENEHTAKVLPCYAKPYDQHGIERPLSAIGPNLIDKSPPIGSIARTLTNDTSCVNKSASHPTSEALSVQKKNEEQECFFLVKSLLSAAGLQGESQPNSSLASWHSSESPLDPSLRVDYIDGLNGKQQRPNRSTQKLAFDCVNEVLIDIARYELESGKTAVGPYSCVLDEVWARMKACFSSQDECTLASDTDMVADRVVREEMMGEGWISCFRSEMDDWRTEIEGTLLEELVLETVVELTGGNS